MKDSDNTSHWEIDRFTYPACSTMIDRYVFANHWTKGRTVIDAATGYGYGAGILHALGAKSVVGIDTDSDAIKDSEDRFQSSKCRFLECDIFKLKNMFDENEFEVCVSIETFEHLPPDRIDEYLQNLKYVTSETIFITTPRRVAAVWKYQGGTHLYEYNPIEFNEIIARNFKGSELAGFGIIEVPLESKAEIANKQWGTTLSDNMFESRIMVGIISL
jgi:SAM-dependent methyltransferase